MFRMNTRCSQHNKPIIYLYTPATPKPFPELFCEACQQEKFKKDKTGSIKLIDDYISQIRGESNKENQKYSKDKNKKN